MAVSLLPETLHFQYNIPSHLILVFSVCVGRRRRPLGQRDLVQGLSSVSVLFLLSIPLNPPTNQRVSMSLA